MSKVIESMRAIGDIEGNEAIFARVKNILNHNERFIFLGDMFAVRSIDSSIKFIEYIMNFFRIN